MSKQNNKNIEENLINNIESLIKKNFSYEEIIKKISKKYFSSDITLDFIINAIQFAYKNNVKLFEMKNDIRIYCEKTKLTKEEIIKILSKEYNNFTVEYITDIYKLYEEQYLLSKKVSKIFVSLLIKHLELSFDHKISSQELKEKLLNEPEMLQYKDYSKLDELVNFYLNMLNSFKKLRAELQLIMGSPANCLSVEELSKQLKSKYPELTLEEIQSVIIQVNK